MTDTELVAYLEEVCRDYGVEVRREFLGEDAPGHFVKLRGRPTVFLNPVADARDLIDVLFHALLGARPYERIALRTDAQIEFDRWWNEQHR